MTHPHPKPDGIHDGGHDSGPGRGPGGGHDLDPGVESCGTGRPVTARRWAVITNPTARTARPARLKAVLRALNESGLEAEVHPTEGPGHATVLARELARGDIEGVAAFGGDGTLREVAAGLLGSPLPLAFLPGGTASVMAHALGIPRDPLRAARALSRGVLHPVRPGMINDQPFLLVAGFGLDAEAVQRVNLKLKQRIGKGAYVWSGLGVLGRRPTPLRLENEAGESWEGAWALVTRSAHYGGRFRAHPNAGLLHPKLGLVMVRRWGVLPFTLGQLGFNLGAGLPGVSFAHGTTCRITADASLAVQIDGDAYPGGRDFHLGLASKSVSLVFGSA